MQDSWKRLTSDSTPWQKTLNNSHSLQTQWHVVSTFCQEMKISYPKGWIRGNTKIGTVLEVTTSYLQGKYWLEIGIESRGSEFLMDWISWSRTWATKSTTTRSRKPPRCSSKIMRWKRMHVLLRADQRLKQNHEDVLLPANLQELYLSVKDLGLILNQQFIRISLTQCQNNGVLFFVMVIYLEKKMERLNSGD